MSTSETTTNNFVTRALAIANKSEDQIQKEAFIDFVETARIDINEKIANIKTGDIPRLQNELKKAENNLAKAQRKFEIVKFTVAGSTEDYIENRESALDVIEAYTTELEEIKTKISHKEKELVLFQEILIDLQ